MLQEVHFLLGKPYSWRGNYKHSVVSTVIDTGTGNDGPLRKLLRHLVVEGRAGVAGRIYGGSDM